MEVDTGNCRAHREVGLHCDLPLKQPARVILFSPHCCYSSSWSAAPLSCSSDQCKLGMRDISNAPKRITIFIPYPIENIVVT